MLLYIKRFYIFFFGYFSYRGDPCVSTPAIAKWVRVTDDMDDDPDVSLFDEPRDVLPNPPNSDPAGVFLAPSLPPKPPHILGAV